MQNANETFNGTKTRFVKYKQFLMVVPDAATHFNIDIYDQLGYYTAGCLEDDNQPVKNIRRQSTCETYRRP